MDAFKGGRIVALRLGVLKTPVLVMDRPRV